MLGEKLFAVGGYDGSAYLSLVEAYDSRWPGDVFLSKQHSACLADSLAVTFLVFNAISMIDESNYN